MTLNWRDRHGEQATCLRCLEVKDIEEMDRLFWCAECRVRGQLRAGRMGIAVGAGVALLLGLWIWLYIRPDRDFILGGWIAIVVAAFYLANRITREIAFGAMRFVNRKAVEAVPPAELPEGGSAGSDEREG